MRHLLFCCSLFVFFESQAQQINPVPDYVFRNQMSVGRNAVTDTAAYISIGPRYGANKGLMPPIVSDTAAITGVKRNGLLIFSVQRNNFQYWDSINSRWTSVTANVDTTVISTRAWRKKGDDSLGALIALKVNISDTATMLNPYTRGSGTVNYVPKFTTTRAFGNSQIFDDGTNVGIGTVSPSYKLTVKAATDYNIGIGLLGGVGSINALNDAQSAYRIMRIDANNLLINTFSASETLLNTSSDAGDYKLQVSGNIYNTGSAVLAATSGNVGIGTTSPAQKLDVNGNIIVRDNATIEDTLSVGTVETIRTTTAGRGNLRLARNTLSVMNISTFDGTAGVNTSILSLVRARGTGTSPAVVQSGDFLGAIVFEGYHNAGAASPAIGSAQIAGVAEETFSASAGGGNLRFSTVQTGTTSMTERMRITSAGELLIGTTTDAGAYALQVAGSIYNTNDAYFGVSSGRLGVGTSTGAGKVSSIQTGAVSPTNAAYWLSHDVSAGSTDGLAIGTNGSASYKWIQSYNGALSINSSGNDVLIGTTTDVGDYRLQVNGNANFRDDVLIDTNLRVNRHIALDQTLAAWSLGNAIQGPQGATLFVAGGGVQTLANIYYDGSYKYTTSNPGAAMFLLQSGITFATYGSGTANGALTGANEMVYAGGELRVGIADQGTFKLQVADKSYFGDEVQIASTTDLGNYKLQVTGEAIITAGIRTDAPSGGTAATWKLGTVATVSPTSPNRTIEVEIGGTTYYIHAKTTNN